MYTRITKHKMHSSSRVSLFQIIDSILSRDSSTRSLLMTHYGTVKFTEWMLQDSCFSLIERLSTHWRQSWSWKFQAEIQILQCPGIIPMGVCGKVQIWTSVEQTAVASIGPIVNRLLNRVFISESEILTLPFLHQKLRSDHPSIT